MTKGRTTTVISPRIPDEVLPTLKASGKILGYGVSKYARKIIEDWASGKLRCESRGAYYSS